MHKTTGVRGLSLRGSSFGPKARIRKKKSAATRAAAVPQPADDAASPVVVITSLDVLVKELRLRLHSLFTALDPNIPTTNLYDNCSQQAFRYFTTTNTITPEAFHHKINKIGLQASKKLCHELFGLVDQEDMGELTFATFSRRIFLPAGYFNFSKPCTPVDRPTSPQPPSARSSRSQSAASPQQQPRPVTPTTTSPRSVHLIYETMSLHEIERLIARKLEERASRSTDRFRQSFRFFTKSEGITYHEFKHHLELLQFTLSDAKCTQLFDRFDLDKNGRIELSEFTAALFRHEENEQAVVRPTTPSRQTPRDGHHHTLRLEDFDVEAGSSLTIQEILSRLRDKLEQHTSKETDRFRQAFKIFSKSSGITKLEFNTAMTKLGLKLTEAQVHDLFVLFDFDKSGDLDLNEFVQGVMLDDSSTKHWYMLKDKQKVAESRRMMYSMAVQSVQQSWTIAEIEQMLREKIEQRTSRSSDCFRQAFRIFKKVNGIKPNEFHAALESIGLPLDRSQADILFQRFDKNGSGDIDLDEFIHGVLPPDYTGKQWVAAADELHREAAQQKKRAALLNKDRFMNEIEMESWGLDEIEKRIRDKIQQATSKSSDTFRQAYKIFKKSSHVSIDEFRERLLALGFRLTPSQCLGLFQRYDTNNSGDIDLQEFCLRILPPDYTGEGDHWSHSEKYHKQREQERLEYVKRSKNGLLMLPKFDESRVRYTRGQHEARDFADLEDDEDEENESTLSGAPPVSMIRPASPAVARPQTPRTPRDQQQQQPQRPSSATSSRRSSSTNPAEEASSPRQLQRPPTPKSARPETSAQPLSPRTTRVAVSSTSVSATSSPSRPSSARPQTPRTPRPDTHDAVSPRRPQTPRSVAAQENNRHEEEDEEIYEDMDERDEEADEQQTAQALRILRSKRRESAHRAHQQRNESQRRQDGDSVSGESTASFSSSMQRTLGAAKFTPTRGNTLLLQRFMRVATKRQSELAKPVRDSSRTSKSKRPHTNRV